MGFLPKSLTKKQTTNAESFIRFAKYKASKISVQIKKIDTALRIFEIIHFDETGNAKNVQALSTDKKYSDINV